MEKVVKWYPLPDIECGCADISFSWISERNAKFVILMHFSRVVDGLEKDLKIVFDRPLSVKCEEESFGLIESPKKLPKCSNKKYKRWTYPLLIIQNSTWKDLYIRFEEDKDNIIHYFFISLNDLLHVLASSEPETSWVPPSRLQCNLINDS